MSNESEYMMQMVDRTMEFCGGKPLPGERDQPDDRAEMERHILDDLHSLWLDGMVWAIKHRLSRDDRYEVSARAARIAAGLGLSEEWEELVAYKRGCE